MVSYKKIFKELKKQRKKLIKLEKELKEEK